MKSKVVILNMVVNVVQARLGDQPGMSTAVPIPYTNDKITIVSPSSHNAAKVNLAPTIVLHDVGIANSSLIVGQQTRVQIPRPR